MNEIKIPKFEGSDDDVRRELRTFAHQVVSAIQYLQVRVEALAEGLEG